MIFTYIYASTKKFFLSLKLISIIQPEPIPISKIFNLLSFFVNLNIVQQSISVSGLGIKTLSLTIKNS